MAENKSLNIQSSSAKLRCGKLIIDCSTVKIFHGNNEIPMPFKTVRVLELLALNPERIVTRDELIDTLWEGNFLNGERSLTTAIWQIRNELIKVGFNGYTITTIPRKGYKLSFDTIEISKINSPLSNKTKSNRRFIYPVLVIATLLLISYQVFFKGNDENFTVIQKHLIPIAVTSNERLEFSPIISPDGNSVLYAVEDNNGKMSLHIASLSEKEIYPSTELFPVTENDYGGLDWAPDGKSISYIKWNRKTKTCQLFRFYLITRTEEVLAPCTYKRKPQSHWSPNGKYIAYLGNDESDKYETLKLYQLDSSQTSDLIISKEQPLPSAYAWQPNSNKLAVAYRASSNHAKAKLSLIALDGTRTHLAEFDGIPGKIQWIGNNIYLTIYINATSSRVMMFNIETGAFTALLLPNQTPSEFSVSKDGSKATYNSLNLNSKIVKSSIIEGQKLKVLTKGIEGAKSPYYHEKMDALFFDSTVGEDDALWKLTFSDNKIKRLDTELLADINSHPRLSPNGQYLSLLTRKEDGCLYISIYQASNFKIEDEFTNCTRLYSVIWSSDSKQLFYGERAKGNFALWQYSVELKEKTKVRDNAGYLLQFYQNKLFYLDTKERKIKSLKRAKNNNFIDDSAEIDVAIQSIWYIANNTIYVVKKLQGTTSIETYNLKGEKIAIHVTQLSPNQSLVNFEMINDVEFIATITTVSSDILSVNLN